MVTSTCFCSTVMYDVNDEINWAELYPCLLTLARRLVYTYRIPSWIGQEEDVAEDVRQETAKRLIERLQKAARGEATPVASPERMMVTIAHNYVLDLMRRDHRMIRLPIEELKRALIHDCNNCEQMEEVATQNIYDEWLFLQLAHEIAHFPGRQRQAILIDLANYTCFDEQLTPLQSAFLAVGIDLQGYQQSLPDDRLKRGQHTSSLYWAYQRLMRCFHPIP